MMILTTFSDKNNYVSSDIFYLCLLIIFIYGLMSLGYYTKEKKNQKSKKSKGKNDEKDKSDNWN